MKLTQTKALMEQKRSVQFLDSYAVLVGKGDQEVLITSPDVNDDTYFDIASMGKVLHTATLILRAVGEGLITLDDPLTKFFENVPEDKHQITLRHLLTHTSGIVRFEFTEEVRKLNHDQVAALILAAPLKYPTGTDYIYSCHGYLLLGFIIEKLYGDRLDRVFYRLMAEPMGLSRSRFGIAVDEPNAAVCYYMPEPGHSRVAGNNTRMLEDSVGGAGASFWSVRDIQTFTKAVLRRDPCLYPRELFDVAEHDYTPHYNEGRGIGWLMVDGRYHQTGDLFPDGSMGHCGNTGTSFFLNRENGLYAIILTNATRRGYERMNWKGVNYDEICDMRAEIHNTILSDLKTAGML